MQNLASLQKKLGFSFKNLDLLKLALTHASWGHERKLKLPHNERLEFLGDAVLSLVTTEYLYQQFPEMPEGHLTKIRSHLVSRPALVSIATELGLGELLLLGAAETANGGRIRASNLANACEAIIGAVFLDAGYNAAREVATQFVKQRLETMGEGPEPDNAKGILQERLHAVGKQAVYRITTEEGPPHKKQFEACVEIDGKVFGTGSGSTKKQAEMRAALMTLAKLDKS
jgi:ribonuclease III